MRGKRILNVFIVLLIILSVFTPFVLYQAPKTEAQTSGGLYKIPIIITEQSGTDLTDYPVRIILNTSNFPYWSHILYEDGSDIYFTDENGNPLYYYIKSFARIPSDIQNDLVGIVRVTNNWTIDLNGVPVKVVINDDRLLTSTDTTHLRIYNPNNRLHGFWVESWDTTTGEAILWLNVTIPAGESETFYLYHDPDATESASNGDATFWFFDDFEEPSLNTSKWEIIEGDIGVSNGELVLYGTSGTRGTIKSYATFDLGNGMILEDRVKWSTTVANLHHFCSFSGVQSGECAGDVYGGGYDNKIQFTTSSGGNSESSDRISLPYSATSYHIYTLVWLSGSSSLYQDGKPVVTHTQYVSTAPQRILFREGDTSGQNVYVDWVRVRPYYDESKVDVIYTPPELSTIIYVKAPYVPANGQTTIYMYYGGSNPYSDYNNPEQVFDLYDDFEDEVLDTSKWQVVGGSATESNGYVYITGSGGRIRTVQTFDNVRIIFKAKMDSTAQYDHVYCGYRADTNFVWDTNLENGNGYFVNINSNYYSKSLSLSIMSDGTSTSIEEGTADFDTTQWHEYEITMYNDSHRVYYDGKLDIQAKDETFQNGYVYFGRRNSDGIYLDYVMIAKYVEPEPLVSIGSEELIEIGIELPSESLYLIHNITYMPNATQFTHTFSAVNNSTADYILGTPDEYGWAVYANPYNNTENNATLISEITINLPYSEVIIENVTLYAKINGTGNYSQLWVKVLNSTGGVVAELINSSLDTNWTKFVIPINANLSNQIKLWINATVESTNTIGEELAIKNVRVSIGYETNPVMRVAVMSNVEYFNASATHTVELGSTEYINSTVITFKLIEYLIFNGTDYPTQPIFIGNETIGSYNYSVYEVSPANYSQVMTIYALMENRLRPMRVLSKGVEVETALVGENITIELPDIARIHIVEINKTYENVSRVSLEFYEVGVYTIKANITEPSMWKLGSALKTIVVKYGEFSVRTLDVESKEIDYEQLTFELVNKTDGQIIRQLVGNKRFELTGLWAGNYTLRVKFKDIVVATKDFELSILTDGSIVNLTCPMKKLPADYRGFARTIITNYDKEIVNVTNISTKFPYSRMSILLNGTGAFKLYVNYQGDLPTDINMTANNVTNLTYYWDGNYLVIEGSLGSLGIINITDLYKVRLEIYDRLGNYMPSWIYAYINETQYFGSIIEDYLYPENYSIELPKTIYGFEFYSYFDGYNETVRNITVNNTDLTYKIWYRIPTNVETLRSYQVASIFRIPFISEDDERVKVYVEGYLLDYYGYGVPNRPLVINVTNVEANITWSLNVTTDASGYFRSPLISLMRGKTYEVEVIYNGDDIYVGTLGTTEIKPEELPTAPAPIIELIPVEYIIIALVGVVAVAAGVVIAVKRVRQTIEDIRESTMRFVRRK